MKYGLRTAAAVTAAVLLLGGCQGRVTEDMLTARENGIALLESGDYEGAVREFESLIENTKRVSEFEIDILKYRAEAEYGLGDYEAAVYTYDVLNQVDEKKAEYYYFGALSLAKGGDFKKAGEWLEEGKKLDTAGEKPGLAEASAEICSQRMLAEMEKGDYEAALSVLAESQEPVSGTAAKELRFNEAVCYEYLGQFEKALSLFQSFTAEFGEDERAEHEIAFLVTR